MPEIMEELRQGGLGKGAPLDQIRSVFTVKPGDVEKIFGKGLPRSDGRTFLFPEDIALLFVHHKFGKKIRTKGHKKTAEKTVRRFIEEEYA